MNKMWLLLFLTGTLCGGKSDENSYIDSQRAARVRGQVRRQLRMSVPTDEPVVVQVVHQPMIEEQRSLSCFQGVQADVKALCCMIPCVLWHLPED